MDKNSRTKTVCDRLAALLLNCSEVDFEKRVNLLQDLCSEWFQLDNNSLASAASSCSSFVSDSSGGCSVSNHVSVSGSDATDDVGNAVIKAEADEEEIRQCMEDSKIPIIRESQISTGDWTVVKFKILC